MLITNYSGPILVTVLYLVFWYYLLLILQRGTKYRLKEKYEKQGREFDRYFGQDNEMLSADRAVINTQEQMVPFLLSMWLHAIFVSVSVATILGVIYVVIRALYPILLGNEVSKIQTKRVYFATLPGYLIVFYLFGSLAYHALVAQSI